MTYGNGVRDDTQQLRDIQELIARLNDVNRRLAQPIRVTAEMPVLIEPDSADNVSA
jgi:hypothetical protein